jgi:hypothetical protein
MKARMILKIRLGPFVTVEIDGESCADIASALEGFEHLNERIDAMCSDLVERVYPDGVPDDPRQTSAAAGDEPDQDRQA